MTTRRTAAAGLVLLAALVFSTAARADEWDDATDSDDPGTDNALFHGSSQVHDLQGQGGTPDEDWFQVVSRPFSSYQVVIDGMTGDLDLSPSDVQRMGPDAHAVLQSATLDPGVLSLTWDAGALVRPAFGFVRVTGATCGAACTANDRYRVRYYDTTYTIPRFNNTGTQSTVLVIQNATERQCIAKLYFFRDDGSFSALTNIAMASGEVRIVPPIFQPQGQSGSVRIAHDCGYGGLAGKAVAIEPSTGFTFDTLLVSRPH